MSKSLLLSVTAGIAALLATGCGTASQAGGGPGAQPPTPQQAVLLAARHADTVNSVTATFSMQISGQTGASISGTLAEQIRPHLLADIELGSIQAAGQSLPGGITALIAGDALYLKSTLFSAASGGKQWVEIKLSDLSGMDLGKLLQQADSTDPLAQTKLLAGATGVRQVGTSTINGVRVTEYTGHYAMADAIAKLPASEQQTLSDSGISGADFTVWLDDQQQMRKLELRADGAALSFTMTITVTSINQPLNVQVPDPSQVKVLSAGDLGAGS